MSDSHDVINLMPEEAPKPANTEPAPEAQPSVSVGEQPQDADLERITTDIVKALKSVYDPEIPVDIYELGLIYKVDYEPEGERAGEVLIDMTLTAPGCPVAGEMPIWVENAVTEVEGVKRVKVDMVFDPPWSPDRMSDEAKLELGWM